MAKASLTLADTLAPEYKPQYQGKIIWNRISSELCFSYDEAGHYILDSVLNGGHEITIKDTKELESKIDFLVYKLYNLAKDEIKIIEGK